jgi:hypothetical protein
VPPCNTHRLLRESRVGKKAIPIAREPDTTNTYLLSQRVYIHGLRTKGKVAENNASLQQLRAAVNVQVIKDFLVEEELMPGDNRNTY